MVGRRQWQSCYCKKAEISTALILCFNWLYFITNQRRFRAEENTILPALDTADALDSFRSSDISGSQMFCRCSTEVFSYRKKVKDLSNTCRKLTIPASNLAPRKAIRTPLKIGTTSELLFMKKLWKHYKGHKSYLHKRHSPKTNKIPTCTRTINKKKERSIGNQENIKGTQKSMCGW